MKEYTIKILVYLNKHKGWIEKKVLAEGIGMENMSNLSRYLKEIPSLWETEKQGKRNMIRLTIAGMKYSEIDSKTKELIKKSVEKDKEMEKNLEELERLREAEKLRETQELEIEKTLKEWEAFKPIFKEAIDIIIEKIKEAFFQ